MATRNTSDDKRFPVRTANSRANAYSVPAHLSEINSSLRSSDEPVTPRFKITSAPMANRSADSSNRQNDGHPARRVVVVRNPNNPNVHEGPVDLTDYVQGESLTVPPAITDGRKSVYLIRRPIGPSSVKPTEDHEEFVDESQAQSSPTNSMQTNRSPTPPKEFLPEGNPPRTPSPSSSPPIRPKSSKYPITSKSTESSEHRATDTRHPVSCIQTPVPSSPKGKRRKPKYVPGLTNRNPSEFEESISPSTVITDNEPKPVQKRRLRRAKSAQRKRSAKPIVLVNPDDHTIAVVENSFVKGDSTRPVMMKTPKSAKKPRFEGYQDHESREKLVETSRGQTCLSCLSRHMCLILVICIILALIGLAGVGVSAYFLATGSNNNRTLIIVGIAVGGALFIGALCFLYIVLACIGARDGYFSYNKEKPRAHKGRAFAVLPSSHSNAHRDVPRDQMQRPENSSLASLVVPVSSTSSGHQSAVYRSTMPVNVSDPKLSKHNIIIEMPERLLTGRKMSPRSRQRSLNKVVQNLGPLVEDAKRHCNGDLPTKVIVKVDKHTT